MERHIHVADCSIYCYNKTSGNAIVALFCTESSLTLSSFSTFKKLAMNTLSKSSSVALAIAFGFSMLATSTSLNAQSREDSDDTGSERSINASDAKPAAKPTVSFRESVKAKVATQAAAPSKEMKGTDVKAAPAPITNQTRVNQNTTATPKTWTKTTASQQKNDSGSESESTKVAATKIATPANTSAVKNNVAVYPVKSGSAIDSDASDKVVNAPNAKDSYTENVNIVKVLSKSSAAPSVKVASPVAAVKYENASPAGKAKVELHAKPSAPVQIVTIVEQHEVKGASANEKSR